MDIKARIMEIYGDAVPYQNWLRPPLNELPAQVHSTQEKLDIVGPYCADGSVLDYGCANGALLLELDATIELGIGFDLDSKAIEAATVAALYYDASLNFTTDTLELWGTDVTLFLSVWKHIRYHHGTDYANDRLRTLADYCDVLLFDAGISGAPTDLGATLKPNDVPDLVRAHTDFTSIMLAGAYTDNLRIRREIWVCQR